VALQCLCNALAAKADERFPCGGRPASLSAENGPVPRRHVLHQGRDSLGIEVKTPRPRGHDGRRPTARAQGKVERPFRTVQEAHETLSPFHAPQTAAEAKAWLCTYRLRYNDSPPRSASQARMEAWGQPRPPEGLREMGRGERFGACARAPETRKVAVDAQGSVSGGRYEVDPDFAGETVTLWFGLYDDHRFVAPAARRDGPSAPSGGPLPLHRERSCKKTSTQKRADRLEGLAAPLSVPRAALSDSPTLSSSLSAFEAVPQPLAAPDPFQQLTFPRTLDAKRAMADHLGMPLAKRVPEPFAALKTLLAATLAQTTVWDHVRRPLDPVSSGEAHAQRRHGRLGSQQESAPSGRLCNRASPPAAQGSPSRHPRGREDGGNGEWGPWDNRGPGA
jgi:hypothetical protein